MEPDVKVAATVQSFSRKRVIWEVASALRIVVTEAWTVVAHVLMLGTGRDFVSTGTSALVQNACGCSAIQRLKNMVLK
jgi:hypothetical protein